MFDDLKNYLNNRIDYAKLEIIDILSNMISAGIYGISVGMVLLLVVVVGSMAGGYLLGEWFGNYGLGFLLIMGIYLIFLVLMLVYRKKFILKLTDMAVSAAAASMDSPDDNSDNFDSNEDED